MSSPLHVHGTCVACGTRAVLMRGPSGSGKSDLAFRLLRDDPSGETRIVADDRVVLSGVGNGLVASAPPALAGLVELRGLGLLAMPAVAEARLALI
ncbi:MAG: aldolase, partial [Alphaproteobacteria bacterium HGW-Alphaproteobacteria-12]